MKTKILVSLGIFALFSFGALAEQKLKVGCLAYYQDQNDESHIKWFSARNSKGKKIYAKGYIKEGFFYPRINLKSYLQKNCLNSIKNHLLDKSEQYKLLRIAVRSHSQDLRWIDLVYDKEDILINKAVIFGDSVSDDGNLNHLVKVYPGDKYFAGRFSNGPIWVDHFRGSSGFAVQNWSIAGAISEWSIIDEHKRDQAFTLLKNGARALATCSIKHEIRNYINFGLNNKKLSNPNSTIFMLWSGGNDYLVRIEANEREADIFLNEPLNNKGGYLEVVRKTIINTKKNLLLLYKHGARNFAVINLPDLGRTPMVLNNPIYYREEMADDPEKIIDLSNKLTQLSQTHNYYLAKVISALEEKLHDANFLLIDSLRAINNMVMNYKNSMLEMISSEEQSIVLPKRCLSVETSRQKRSRANIINPGALFWDNLHPTSESHNNLSDFFIQRIKDEYSVEEF